MEIGEILLIGGQFEGEGREKPVLYSHHSLNIHRADKQVILGRVCLDEEHCLFHDKQSALVGAPASTASTE